MENIRSGHMRREGRFQHGSAAIAVVLVMSAVPLHRGACTEPSEGEQAIAALEEAGAIIEYAEPNPRREVPSKDISKILFLSLSTNEKAVASLAHLKDLPHPEKITLEFRVFPATLSQKLARHAEDLAKLKAVRIDMDMNIPVSDKDICHLSEVTNLQFLGVASLDRLDVTDSGLACLKNLRDLRGLALVNTRVTDAGLVHLKKLKNLEFLSLVLTEVTGEGFAQLKDLPLRDLFLVDTPVDDQGLNSLQDFRQLERLALTNCPIKGSGLKHLTHLKNLRELALAGTGIDDTALACLQALPRLERLVLSRCEITDASVPSLTKLKNLKRLSLNETKISREGFHKIQMALPNATVEY